ncbi:hypothetical protein Godav_023726 [Gossypium davidsonii]|uniref:Uncharacterized protein n=1 Tax=Gossypium davidsonii TaxID=34287 RepID=A0A7J8ST71_GOSDV|nr:hypothetical protein [Gossypium davidsonii]
MRRVYHHFGGRAITIGIVGRWIRRSNRDRLATRHIPGAGE